MTENILNTSSEQSNDRWGLYLENEMDRLVKFLGFVDIPLLREQRDKLVEVTRDVYDDDIDALVSMIDSIIDGYLAFNSI